MTGQLLLQVLSKFKGYLIVHFLHFLSLLAIVHGQLLLFTLALFVKILVHSQRRLTLHALVWTEVVVSTKIAIFRNICLLFELGQFSFENCILHVFESEDLVFRKALENLVKVFLGHLFGPRVVFVAFILFHNHIVAMILNVQEIFVCHFIHVLWALMSCVQTLIAHLFIVNSFCDFSEFDLLR